MAYDGRPATGRDCGRGHSHLLFSIFSGWEGGRVDFQKGAFLRWRFVKGGRVEGWIFKNGAGRDGDDI